MDHSIPSSSPAPHGRWLNRTVLGTVAFGLATSAWHALTALMPALLASMGAAARLPRAHATPISAPFP